jgi:hypothetical protein
MSPVTVNVPPDCANAMALLRRNILFMAELPITRSFQYPSNLFLILPIRAVPISLRIELLIDQPAADGVIATTARANPVSALRRFTWAFGIAAPLASRIKPATDAAGYCASASSIDAHSTTGQLSRLL